MSHRCPVQVCRWTVGDDSKLMCPKHWAMVPRHLQKAVYAAYAHGKGMLPNRLPGPALAEAQLAAVRFVDGVLAGTSHD